MIQLFRDIIKEEAGGTTLILALLLVFFGGLMVPPIMDFVDSGLKVCQIYEQKTNEVYAADSGIEDALWQMKYGDLESKFTSPAYDVYDYETIWSYSLPETINGCTVDVSLENIWIPKDITPPTASEARDIVDTAKLVVSGNTPDSSTYEIRVTYYPEDGEDLKVESLGVWLPVGFSFISDSSNLEELLVPLPSYYSVPDVEPYCGGEVVVWDFDSVPFVDFPGIDPLGSPLTAEITLGLNSIQENVLPVAIAWIETSGVTDIELSWDADVKIFELVSTAGDARAEVHAAKCELRELSARIDGDYRAIGNSLMIDGSGPDPKARYDLLAESSAQVNDIPSDAEVAAAYLYWSGWIENPITGVPAWEDDCSNFDSWDGDTADDWDISSGEFRGHHALGDAGASERYLTMSSSIDLSGHAGEDLSISFEVDEDGALEGDGNEWRDALYVAFSSDGGSTWGSNIEAFYDDNPSSPFIYDIPQEYLTNDFRIKFYLGDAKGWRGGDEFCYIDNISIAESAFADSSVIFKIDGTQVYFDGDGLPQEDPAETEEITASREMIMENKPGEYSYSCYLDVTDLIREFCAEGDNENHPGNGTYTIGDVYADTGNKWSYAGWSLIIIYTSADTHGHQLFLYDEFAYADEYENVDFDNDGEDGGIITGFIIPEKIDGETNAAKLTCFVGEGDVWYTGDYLRFNGTSLYNADSPSNNVWNSASPGISEDGVDIDTFNITWASNLLEPGDTSAQLDLPTGVDSWNLVYIILSIRSETLTPGAMDYIIEF